CGLFFRRVPAGARLKGGTLKLETYFVMKNRQATCCLPAIYHENVFLLSELKPLPFLSYTS
ncbi:hypothetical protein PL430_21995, partial [Phocaeicola vulgatus]|nr:hypothetical protein [Phocaeicola vulgatus]